MHITFRRALIGGIAATILWEITRRALVWYYSVISMVNLIYGSFATAVVALLSTEAVALILLLGAQVIAELSARPAIVPGRNYQVLRHEADGSILLPILLPEVRDSFIFEIS